jgi:hypothetical protein
LTLPLTDFTPRWGEIRAKSKDQAKNPSIEAGFFDGRVKTLPYSKSTINPNLMFRGSISGKRGYIQKAKTAGLTCGFCNKKRGEK